MVVFLAFKFVFNLKKYIILIGYLSILFLIGTYNKFLGFSCLVKLNTY